MRGWEWAKRTGTRQLSTGSIAVILVVQVSLGLWQCTVHDGIPPIVITDPHSLLNISLKGGDDPPGRLPYTAADAFCQRTDWRGSV